MQVTVRNTMYDKVINQSRTMTYSGDEIPLPKWVSYPAVALTTGNHKFPFRIIPKEDIVSIDNTAVQYKAEAVTNRTIPVKGKKGQIYLITIDGSHKSCTCLGYQFRRNCSHLAEAA